MTVTEISALLMAAVALAGLFLQRRKVKVEEHAGAVENLNRLLADLKSAYDQIDAYRDQLESSRDQEDDCLARLTDERRKHAATLAELGVAMRELAAIKAGKNTEP